MTTRRQFCKNLCAAGLMPATLTSFAKFYCGMDFGSGGSTTVWHIIPSDVYCRWALGQISAEELVGGRADPKPMSLYSRPPTRKTKGNGKSKEDKLKYYQMLWFEEASDFDTEKGNPNV